MAATKVFIKWLLAKDLTDLIRSKGRRQMTLGVAPWGVGGVH
jgi:hypothetical protein